MMTARACRYLFMDFVDGGSLEQLREMKPQKLLMESEARWFFKQLIVGLMYIHQQGIVHRGMSPFPFPLVHHTTPSRRPCERAYERGTHA